MAKLTRYLEDIRGGGRGFGFGAQQQKRSPSLALIVQTGPADAKSVAAAAEAGADAVVVSPSAKGEMAEGLKGVFEGSKGKPRGLALAGEGTADVVTPAALGDLGVDFLILEESQPAAVMAAEVEKVARLALDFDPIQVRALEALGMDAFLLSLGEMGEGARLSIKDLARVRLLAGATSKPVLVEASSAGLRSDLEVLMQTGIEGILLNAEKMGANGSAVKEQVKAFREAVDRLGPRRAPKRRPGDELPLVPRSAMPVPSEVEEGGDEPFDPD